jgi:hypothetical protein
MITIKKSGRIHQIPNDDFMAAQDTSDGMYLRFKDGSELRILAEVTAEVKAAARIIVESTAKNVTLDFDSRPMISITG